MKTVTFTVEPMVERRVNNIPPMIDPMQKQEDDFMKVWLAMRNQTMMLGAGRPLICEETMAANRSHCYD